MKKKNREDPETLSFREWRARFRASFAEMDAKRIKKGQREAQRRQCTQHLRESHAWNVALQAWIDEHRSAPTPGNLWRDGSGGRRLHRAATHYHDGIKSALARFAYWVERQREEEYRSLPNVRRLVEAWIATHGHFPTRRELAATGDQELLRVIERYWFGIRYVRDRLGYRPITSEDVHTLMADFARTYNALPHDQRVGFFVWVNDLIQRCSTIGALRTALGIRPSDEEEPGMRDAHKPSTNP